MSARDDLREWVSERAADPADAARGSKLIAAYVADAVREDRRKQAEKARQTRELLDRLDTVREKFRDLATRGPI